MEFREMRRKKQQVSEEETKDILRQEKRGVLSVVGDNGYPFAIPVDFRYDEEENRIYIHGGKSGHKIDAIKACNKVCFTTWGGDTRKEDDWAFYVTSVVVFGKAILIEDPAVMEDKVRKLALKYYPTAEAVEAEIARDIGGVQLLAIDIEHMTGKRVHEK